MIGQVPGLAFDMFTSDGKRAMAYFRKSCTEVGTILGAPENWTDPLGYAILGGFYAVVHSFLEEYYFRWFVFGRLRELLRFAPAAIVSGLAFMAHHVIVLYVFLGPSLHTAFLSLCIAAGGFIWAWQYERSRSLLGPWISHMIVDTGIFLVGYHMLFVAS